MYLSRSREHTMSTKRTTPIRFDVRLHELGEQINLPYPVKRALAWWIAAEMIRRHPDEVRVIETHPGGGQYDCLSLYRRDADDDLVAHMNLVGHITHESWFGNHGETDSGVDDPRFNWLEVLAAEDRRSYVIEALEGVCGFTTPNKTPPTARKSIGPRLIARFASAAAFTTRTWHIRNAFHDSSGMWSGVNEWARDIRGPRFNSLESDLLGEPHYRYWFVLNHKHEAAAVVDVDLGVAWRRERPDTAYELMDLYAAHASRIDRVMAEVFPAVE
jgi:hypothetical protein